MLDEADWDTWLDPDGRRPRRARGAAASRARRLARGVPGEHARELARQQRRRAHPARSSPTRCSDRRSLRAWRCSGGVAGGRDAERNRPCDGDGAVPRTARAQLRSAGRRRRGRRHRCGGAQRARAGRSPTSSTTAHRRRVGAHHRRARQAGQHRAGAPGPRDEGARRRRAGRRGALGCAVAGGDAAVGRSRPRRCGRSRPTNRTAAFWQRRRSQETAVHRYDAEIGRGEPDPDRRRRWRSTASTSSSPCSSRAWSTTSATWATAPSTSTAPTSPGSGCSPGATARSSSPPSTPRATSPHAARRPTCSCSSGAGCRRTRSRCSATPPCSIGSGRRVRV